MTSVLLLTEAKTHLNITVGTYDTELQDVIDAAEAVLSQHVGPLQSTARTDRVPGYVDALVLPMLPVVSLTSVTSSGGTVLTLSDLYVDQRSGVVTYNSGACFTERYYTVVYSAGRASCPDDLLLADKELVRHLWGARRGGAQRPGSAPSESTANTIPGAGYLLPFRVQQLIAPHVQPGFA